MKPEEWDALDALLNEAGGGAAGEPGANPARATPPPAAEDDGESPVLRLVERLLDELGRSRASALHLEPEADGSLRVRLRVDGTLRPGPTERVPRQLAPGTLARLKILAQLDIAERRLPQSGCLALEDGRRFAVMTLPTPGREMLVVRALEPASAPRDLAGLGLEAPALAAIEAALDRARGLILIAGPARSGRSTLLRSSLARAARPDRCVVSIAADGGPLAGVVDVRPNGSIGLTTAAAFRGALRCQPDVIGASDLADAETVHVAVSTAGTGPLVLGTIHTPDAPATVIRCLDMGIEPWLFADALSLVVALRLLRRLCDDCKTGAPAPREVAAARIFRSNGCAACAGTGFRGLLPVAEVLAPDAALRAAIGGGAADLGTALSRAAEPGLRQAALDRVAGGATSLEEALRMTSP